ncbi:MAG TPA: TIGR00282 family metallophosphoesterase [Patescibacteria group bacterium]|nr:TIGR00282 family metallophosphoesterase [Patescibacteria group bacterium]
MLKIIFFGDICGEPGRRAVKQSLPEILDTQQPDLVLANVENLAHGKGVTVKTLEELIRAGISGFTGGNHIFSKRDFTDEVFSKYGKILVRPTNIPDTYSGSESIFLETKKGKVLVGNFLGQVFMDRQFHDPIGSPFEQIQNWLTSNQIENPVATIIDFHAEATSEKVAFGYFLDGKVSAMLGTHTHIPTADYKVLPAGTAYITDVGMCGAAGSVLGVEKELSLARFTTGTHVAFDIPKDVSSAELSYVIIDIDETNGRAAQIQGVHRIIKLK